MVGLLLWVGSLCWRQGYGRGTPILIIGGAAADACVRGVRRVLRFELSFSVNDGELQWFCNRLPVITLRLLTVKMQKLTVRDRRRVDGRAGEFD